jgi:hypothetical protein
MAGEYQLAAVFDCSLGKGEADSLVGDYSTLELSH